MSYAPSALNQEELNDLSDYFHAAPIALHLTDSEGTITKTNLAELELLGYNDHPEDFIGRNMMEFHAEPDCVPALLDRLLANERVTECETTLLRRDGAPQRVLLYANAKMKNGKFDGVRACTFPHPGDLHPDIASIGALKDESIENRGLQPSPAEELELFLELRDFFQNSPVNLHIVGADGLIKYASRSEIESMGYDPESYLGAHIARFHADQAVIDGMLTNLVSGTPLVNFNATLFHKDGSKMPVMIYSNSRMRDGNFINTRCFTVPLPNRSERSTQTVEFSWPRNEDLGFTAATREQNTDKPDPITLALRYIAARKRPEESLGFLAKISQALAQSLPLDAMLDDVAKLSVPFLADFASVDGHSLHLAHAGSPALNARAEAIVQYLRNNPTADLSALHDLGITWHVSSPLAIRGRIVGTLTFLRQASRQDFGPADRALAEEVARRIAFGLEIERLASRG